MVVTQSTADIGSNNLDIPVADTIQTTHGIDSSIRSESSPHITHSTQTRTLCFGGMNGLSDSFKLFEK
jgi:hypothetical protein